jgi:hypothetical protein
MTMISANDYLQAGQGIKAHHQSKTRELKAVHYEEPVPSY